MYEKTCKDLFFVVMKKIIILLFILLTPRLYAQVTISGQVIDSDNKPVEAATVLLSKVKSNSVLEYSMTNAKGIFEIKIKPQEEEVVLKVSMIGYKTFNKEFTEIKGTSLDLGIIKLEEESVSLDELIIKSEVPLIRIKKDTLEFNAASFSVRPDANLEELLKQLPGLHIDENKSITINGKTVGEILVNGKPFFGDDGKIALENLPADIINKVQVTDKKTKQEKFTGERAKSDQSSINITIEKDKNKGYFGKFSGGYGSDDRYESSLFFNAFANKTKVSVIGSANNINAIGFGMDEVFDNMRSVKSGGGITTSRLLGANFVQEINPKLNVNGSYNYNFSETERKNRFNSTNILPSGEFFDLGSSQSLDNNEGNSANISLDYIGGKDSFYIMPTFSKNFSQGESTSFTEARNSAGNLLNDNNSTVKNSSTSDSFSNSMRYMRKFKRDKQFLSIDFTNTNNVNNNHAKQESTTNFYQSEYSNDIRKQFQSGRNSNDSYSVRLEYSQPITDSLAIFLGADWSRRQIISNKEVYDFDDVTQEYSELNILQSNRYTTIQNNIAPYFGYNFVHKKFSSNLNTSTEIFKNDASALYNGKVYTLDKQYINPNISYRMDYRFSKSNVLFMSYRYNVSYQSAEQLLDIRDVSNPLNTVVGNPDLKPTSNNNVGVNYRSYNFQNRSGFSVGGNLTWLHNDIVNAIEYDEDRKATSTYKNSSGNYSWALNGNWYRSHTIDELVIRYGINARFNQSFSKGIMDGVDYNATSNNLSPRVYLNLDYGDLLRIRPSYNYNRNWTSYQNFSVDKASYYTHNLGLETVLYWPSNFTFGSDFNYNYNSQIASGYKKDSYMWNLSFAYEFYDKAFKAKLKVYDVLNQNTSSKRTIYGAQIIDSENLVLKQYFMLSLTYSLKDFGAKNRQELGMKRERNQNFDRTDRPRQSSGRMMRRR